MTLDFDDQFQTIALFITYPHVLTLELENLIDIRTNIGIHDEQSHRHDNSRGGCIPSRHGSRSGWSV
jgi:hypothetical protein